MNTHTHKHTYRFDTDTVTHINRSRLIHTYTVCRIFVYTYICRYQNAVCVYMYVCLSPLCSIIVNFTLTYQQTPKKWLEAFLFFGTPFAYPSKYPPSQGGMRIPKKKVVREGQERGLSIRTNTLPHIHREVTVIVECFFPG